MTNLSNFKFCAIIISILIPLKVSAYCWEAGKNPGFSGPPIVQQINMNTVRVSWVDLVTQKDCADQFIGAVLECLLWIYIFH